MKKLLLLLLLPTSVFAAPTVQEKMQVCSKIYDLAEKVMKNRQEGIPLNKALIPVYEQKNANVQMLHKDMIVAAYKKPIQTQDKDKITTAKTFAEKYATTCLELASK